MVGSNRGSSGNNKRKVFRYAGKKFPFARLVVGDAVPCVLSREKLPGTPSQRTFRAIWGWGLRGKGNLTSSYPSPIIFDIFFDKTNKTTAAQALMATKSIKKS